MQIRNELNANLFNQKIYGDESVNQHIDNEILQFIKNGEFEKIIPEKIKLNNNRLLSHNSLQNMKFSFVISAAFIADECHKSGLSLDEANTITDIYCRKADTLLSEEIENLFKDMCLDFAKRMNEIRREKVISIHIRKCIKHIYNDLSADLSISGLAKFAGLNESYLAKLFKKETGMTLKSYVTSARMDTAQNLLKYSKLTNSQIAVSLGYSSQSAFIYAFRKFNGITPQRYREINFI